ncbi:MAG: hypothetical protein ACRCT2_08925 [Plesiomonas shigelloides]
MADLAIVVCHGGKFSYGHIIGVEFVGAISRVMDEANNFYCFSDGSIWALVCGSVGLCFVSVEEGAADE